MLRGGEGAEWLGGGARGDGGRGLGSARWRRVVDDKPKSTSIIYEYKLLQSLTGNTNLNNVTVALV